MTRPESKAYVAGRHCRKGRHSYDEDHGSWVRCVKCGSTRTKPRGMDLAVWKLIGKVHCPDCTDGMSGYGKNKCATCGGEEFLTRNEYNYLVKMRAGGSPAGRLERV